MNIKDFSQLTLRKAKSQSVPKVKIQEEEKATLENQHAKKEKVKKVKVFKKRDDANDDLLIELNEILRCGSGSSNEDTLCSGLDELNIKIEYR